MIKKLLYISITLLVINGYSQVGIGTTNPNASSMLDVTSTTAGILIPRMTIAQRNLITSPATGLLIYQNDSTPGFYYYNGTAWTPFGSSGWSLTGNTGTSASTNFIGTTDGNDFVIKVAGTEAMRVKNGGNVGIGSNNPTTKLHVLGTTTLPTSGTTNLLNQNFNSAYTVVHANNGMTGCSTPATNGWERSTTGVATANCTSCTLGWLYINSDETGCIQNATARVDFTTAPTATTISISFSYRYNYFSGPGDTFRAFLYNNTTNAQVGANLVGLLTADADSNYSGTATVVAGNSYSLRFEYNGDFDYGASVDTILVTEATTPTAGSYIFRLEDGTQAAGKVMVSDANGNGYWGSATSGTDNQSLSISGNNLTISNGNTVTLPSGSGSYTFQNGLTDASGIVKLGGALTENTSIGATAYDLNVSSASKTNMLQVDYDENLVKFGHDTLPYDEGVGISLDGFATTVEYITSAYNGYSSGTTVGLGSVEYLTDGEAIIGASDSILPIWGGLDLGSSTDRWNTLYCTNTVNTSDANLKKNIAPLRYGINDLMKLKPVSYNWRNNKIGKTTIPENLEETKLGFLAQDLLTVLPEVVKTHDWKITDEKRPKEYSHVKNEVLGVMYNEIIPVVVKAVQEQQEQIVELKKTVEELKKQNELLLQLVNKK